MTLKKMIPQSIEAVIFDFDGVIVDTEKIGINVSSGLIKRLFDLDLSEEDKQSFYGLQDLLYYQKLLEKHNLDSDASKLLEMHNQEYDVSILKVNAPLLGVKETLTKFQKIKLPIALCSGSYESQIRNVLANLNLSDYFRIITSAEETQNHKPHPEPYLLTARKLEIEPNKCLVFEDSNNGVISAKRAGMYVIGVMIGNHGTQNLNHADMVVHSLKELLENRKIYKFLLTSFFHDRNPGYG